MRRALSVRPSSGPAPRAARLAALVLLALPALLAGSAAAAADRPTDRVRFAPVAAGADPDAVRARFDRYLVEAGLHRDPASRRTPESPIPVEKSGGRVRAELDGRFLQLLELDATGAATCGAPARGPVLNQLASAEVPAATISRNAGRLQGADREGRVLIYTPDPYEAGSSISHWDRRASPSLLMEPALSPGEGAPRLDITPAAMEDMGWRRGTSRVEIVSLDPPGVGLNDPRPFAGAPGNPATTLGGARRHALEAAFGSWAETLQSAVPIVAVVRFSELFCQPGVGAILAGAGPLSAWANLDHADDPPNTWYPAALAESLDGTDLTGPVTITGGGDIQVAVNAFLDEGCFGPGSGWYYGLDNRAPDRRTDFYAVLLHELAHGLGMLTFTDGGSGAMLRNWPTIYDTFLYDPVLGKSWPQLDNAARAGSARRHGRLVWNGPKVKAAAPTYLTPGAVELRIADGPAAGEHPTVPARFGRVADTPLTAPVACAADAVAPALDACTPLPAGSLAGKIALVELGNCLVEVKSRHAQQAGAVGVILANLRGETQLQVFADADTSDIVIPVVAVGRSAALRLETAACPAQARPLAGGRFDVRAAWFTEEAVGNAEIIRLTADSVYATFFDPENPELVVKVLNACTSPVPRFWVFANGLTDVGVELTVTDTVTGLSRGYFNPPSHPFELVRDTDAFPCAPVP